MKFYASLKTVLMVSFILASVLPMLIAGFISLRSLTESLELEITEKNFILAKSLSGEVGRFLDEPLNFILHIEAILENTALIPENMIDDYMNSVVQNYPIFERIEILDRYGTVIHAAPDLNTLKYNMAGQPFYGATNELPHPYWSPTFLSLQTNQPTLTLSVPFTGGMVVGYINLATLNTITNKVSIGNQGYAAIVDGEGIVIAHPNEMFVSERLNVTNLEMVRLGLAGEEGSYHYQFEGVNKLGSVAIISHTKWLLVVQQPLEEAFATITALRNIVIGGIAAALLLAVTIASVSLRSALRPFSRLTESTKKIAKGNYSFAHPGKSYREINDLADAFTIMCKAIKDRENALRRLNTELDQRVTDRTAQLGRANKDLESFAYSVSHDLRAPIRHIGGFVELLEKNLKTKVDAKSRHYIETITDAAKRMGLLIDGLLSFSRLGTNKLSNEPVHLNLLIEDIIQEMEPDIMSRNIKWHIDELPVVMGDHILLRIVFANLITNALKFTSPRDTANIEIGQQRLPNGKNVMFVRDNGVGFDNKYADKLFGVFQRLHRKEEFDGIGVGLANVHRIVTRHGGKVWAEGTIDKGAIFFVTLPLAEIN